MQITIEDAPNILFKIHLANFGEVALTYNKTTSKYVLIGTFLIIDETYDFVFEFDTLDASLQKYQVVNYYFKAYSDQLQAQITNAIVNLKATIGA